MAKPLALTSGEPAGIGPDITIKAWLRRNELKLPTFYLLGDRDLLDNRAKALGLTLKLADVRAEASPAAFAEPLPTRPPPHSRMPCRWWPPAMRRRRGPANPTTPARTPPWPRFAGRSAMSWP